MSAASLEINDDFAARLRNWRTCQKLSQSEASRLLGIDRSYFSQIERGRLPGKPLRARFALLEKTSLSRGRSMARVTNALRNIPVLSWDQAAEAIDLQNIADRWEEVVPSDVADEAAFAVRLRGDSMEPKFSDGDIAVLLPAHSAMNGETVVANLRGEGVVCKIMQVHSAPDFITLSSYNSAFPPMERHRDRFHWIFPVATVLKQLRRG